MFQLSLFRRCDSESFCIFIQLMARERPKHVEKLNKVGSKVDRHPTKVLCHLNLQVSSEEDPPYASWLENK